MNRRLFLGSAIALSMPPFPRWTEDPLFPSEHKIVFGPAPADMMWMFELEAKIRRAYYDGLFAALRDDAPQGRDS